MSKLAKQAADKHSSRFSFVRWGVQKGVTGCGRNGFYQQTGVEVYVADPEAREVQLSGLTSRNATASGYVVVYGEQALRDLAAKLLAIADA